jgi:hypothetical protein
VRFALIQLLVRTPIAWALPFAYCLSGMVRSSTYLIKIGTCIVPGLTVFALAGMPPDFRRRKVLNAGLVAAGAAIRSAMRPATKWKTCLTVWTKPLSVSRAKRQSKKGLAGTLTF